MGETHLHTGYWEPGAGGGGGWAGGVGQKADRQGCREQTRSWSWGVEGQKGKPEEQLGVQVSEVGILGEPGKARAKEGVRGESRWGAVALPRGVTPPLTPQFQFLPPTLTP